MGSAARRISCSTITVNYRPAEDLAMKQWLELHCRKSCGQPSAQQSALISKPDGP